MRWKVLGDNTAHLGLKVGTPSYAPCLGLGFSQSSPIPGAAGGCGWSGRIQAKDLLRSSVRLHTLHSRNQTKSLRLTWIQERSKTLTLEGGVAETPWPLFPFFEVISSAVPVGCGPDQCYAVFSFPRWVVGFSVSVYTGRRALGLFVFEMQWIRQKYHNPVCLLQAQSLLTPREYCKTWRDLRVLVVIYRVGSYNRGRSS